MEKSWKLEQEVMEFEKQIFYSSLAIVNPYSRGVYVK